LSSSFSQSCISGGVQIQLIAIILVKWDDLPAKKPDGNKQDDNNNRNHNNDTYEGKASKKGRVFCVKLLFFDCASKWFATVGYTARPNRFPYQPWVAAASVCAQSP